VVALYDLDFRDKNNGDVMNGDYLEEFINERKQSFSVILDTPFENIRYCNY